MISGRWRGARNSDVPQWRLEARKRNAIAKARSYSNGGMPRKVNKPRPISLPKLSLPPE